MLVTTKGHEMFKNMTREQINKMVSGHCKTEACAHHHQAKTLAPLREELVTHHNKHQGFKLEDRARLINER